MKTKIFLDSGDPKETKEALDILGFLDGQTTNPSLIAKNPQTTGKKFTHSELLDFYKKVVQEVSVLIPDGSVSVEVYADRETLADEMFRQAKEFNAWIPNAHIKYPTTIEGLKAAELSLKQGIKVNMTLVFSQSQAAAVYAASLGAKKGDVFLSPFIGRLDDKGERGVDFIKNVLKMYKTGDGHVEVLSASIRNLNHLVQCLEMGSDIVTVPVKVLAEWKQAGMPTLVSQLKTESGKLKPIEFEEISLKNPWQEYNIEHELTDRGIEKFAGDWNNLILH